MEQELELSAVIGFQGKHHYIHGSFTLRGRKGVLSFGIPTTYLASS